MRSVHITRSPLSKDLRDDDPEPERVRSVGVSSDFDGVTTMLKQAVSAGFPRERAVELEAIVRKSDIWRTKFRASDPPADVPPMSITLKSDAHPPILVCDAEGESLGKAVHGKLL